MASLEKRRSTYRVIFHFAGRKFSRSLLTRHLTEARASVARLEDNLRRMELGLLDLPPDADLPSFLLSDGRALSKPFICEIQTLSDLSRCYFADLPKGALEVNTLDGMKIHVKHLNRLFGASSTLNNISTAAVQSYVTRRCAERTRSKSLISPATTKKEIVTLRTMWNWAVTMGHLKRPFPGRGLKFPKLEAKLPFRTLAEVEARLNRGGYSKVYERQLWEATFLSLPELELLLEHVKNTASESCLHPMIVFAAHTGARRSEMLRSEIDDIDFQNRVALIRERKRVRGTKSTRIVPLSTNLMEVLSDWFKRHPGGNLTFCTSNTATLKRGSSRAIPLSTSVAHKHFKRVLAGSRFSKLRGWHVLRHSFCSNCAARGIDQRVINAWVGHQSEEMVQRYRHLLPTQSKDSIELVFGVKSA